MDDENMFKESINLCISIAIKQMTQPKGVGLSGITPGHIQTRSTNLNASQRMDSPDNIEEIIKQKAEREQRRQQNRIKKIAETRALNETIAEPIENEKIVKGFRVKVSYDSLTDAEMKYKKEAIAKIVLDAIRKRKQ